MVNILFVATIFIIILIIVAGFITHQYLVADKIAANNPKSLIEKMSSSGIGALDQDKFEELVMSNPSSLARLNIPFFSITWRVVSPGPLRSASVI